MPPEARLTPAARRDLEGVWRYTQQTWGVEQANRYIDILTEAFQGLARSPLSAPACDHIRPGYRRRSVGRHVVYFKVTPYGIAVVRVLHARMEAPRHL
jgi:toxin ParE1/3/4